ncbi:MAG: TrmO family methyltransferase [Pseudanabaenaceae cyanobacterium]
MELLEINALVLRVKGIEVIYGTPLLDTKPYIPEFNTRTNCCTG